MDGICPRAAAVSDSDARLGWLILIGTLPIAGLGMVFKQSIESTLRHLQLTAIMLIAFDLLLGVADRVGRKTQALKDIKTLSVNSTLSS